MGTHPIFESDFDCLTDAVRLKIGNAKVPYFLSSWQLQSVKETVLLILFHAVLVMNSKR